MCILESSTNPFFGGVKKWQELWEKYIFLKGDYIEKLKKLFQKIVSSFITRVNILLSLKYNSIIKINIHMHL